VFSKLSTAIEASDYLGTTLSSEVACGVVPYPSPLDRIQQDARSKASGQIYLWGKFVEYSGPVITHRDINLPDDIKIKPWEPLPTMVLLTIQGVTVAGPARLKLLKSYAYELCNSPEKAQVNAIRWEVNGAIENASTKVRNA